MIVHYNVELDRNRHPIMVKEKSIEHTTKVITCPEDAWEILRDIFHADMQSEEHVYLISLSTRKHVLGVFDVAHGQVAGCMITPREIFLRAIVSGAVSIIMAHNHPSGYPEPSEDDNAFVERVKNAGEVLNIPLDDSIIIGDNMYYSYHGSGLL